MKHLLNGVAIAAALAIAAPAWAQAPMSPAAKSPPNAAAPAAAPADTEAKKPMAMGKQRHRRGARHMASRGGRGGRAGRGGAPSMTDQLNREELARIQSGAPSAAGGVGGQPNELRGIPGAGQPSASQHPGQPR